MRRTFLLGTTGVVGWLLAAVPLRAQTAAPPPQPPVTVKEQVEVVATRIPEAPHDVPVSIEVIDGETLRARGVTTLRDALALAAGVEVAPGGDGGPASSVPEFWGLREFDAFLLVVDDIPWGGAFNPALATLNLRDVERIEVLRGPAPVTYGATSFVGVLHVVHKAAAANRSYLFLRGGTFGSGTGALDLSMPSRGSWKSRLTADFDRQGFKDDRTSYTRGHANYRGATSGTDRKMWVVADLNWIPQEPASPHARDGASLSTATPLDANYNPADAKIDETRFTAAFGTERRVMKDGRWTTLGSYSHSGSDQFRGFLTTIADAPDNATGFKETIDVNDIYADSHVTWPLNARTQIVAGGDFLFGNGEGRGAVFTYTVPLSGATATVVPEPTTLDRDAESRREFFGGYAQVELTASARVHVSGGLRLNATRERRGEGETTTHTRPAGGVGVLVRAWEQGADHVRLFVNYRDTFKPAAFDFSLAENEGVLDPETARSVDGGMKARVADGRIDLEVSAFRMNFQNLVTATVVDGLPSLQNTGSTRFEGVDLAGEARWTHDISGRATYSFHNGKYVDFVQSFDDQAVQLAGNRFEMSARHLFSAGLFFSPQHGLFGDVVIKYVGDRFLDKRNTALAEPYTTFDIGAGYRLSRWDLRLDGRNLSDRRDPTSESELGEAQYYRLWARRFDVSAGLRF